MNLPVFPVNVLILCLQVYPTLACPLTYLEFTWSGFEAVRPACLSHTGLSTYFLRIYLEWFKQIGLKVYLTLACPLTYLEYTWCGLSNYRLAPWPSQGKAFYSSRPGSTLEFTNVRLIFMNDSFIKCVSSILKY